MRARWIPPLLLACGLLAALLLLAVATCAPDDGDGTDSPLAKPGTEAPDEHESTRTRRPRAARDAGEEATGDDGALLPSAEPGEPPPDAATETTHLSAQQADVRLRVLDDATGAPVAGADVRFVAAGEDPSGSWYRKTTLDLYAADGTPVPEKSVASATTDRDGRSTLPGAPLRRPHTAVVRAAGFSPGFATVVPTSPRAVSAIVRLRRAGTIACRVLDFEGRPVAGTVVRSRVSGPADAAYGRRADALGIGERVQRTDERGAAAFDDLDDDGLYDLFADHAGHRVTVPRCRTSREPFDPVVLRLPATGRLVLRFPGVTTRVRPDEVWIRCMDCGQSRSPTAEEIAGAPSEVAAGMWRVRVHAQLDRPGGSAEVFVPAGGEAVAEVAWATVTPLVVHISDVHGDACECSLGFWLSRDDEDESPFGGEGGHGPHTARFDAVPPGRWVVRASARDRVAYADTSTAYMVITTPCEPVTIALPPPPSLAIRHAGPAGPWRAEVHVPGGPPGTRAAARWECEWSDFSDGPTELTAGPASGVPAGPARVSVFVPGFLPWTRDVTLEPGRETVVFADSLVPGAAISGRILDGEGRAVPDAAIQEVPVPVGDAAQAPGPQSSGSSRLAAIPWRANEGVRSDADGSFGPLTVPPGRVVLEVRAAGFAARRVAVEARAGMPPVEIRMFRGGTVEVVVADAAGVAAPGVEVRASAIGATQPAGWKRTGATDHRGRAALVLSPGRWSVAAEGTSPVEVDVADGASRVVPFRLP